VAGALNLWFLFVFLVFAAWMVYLRVTSQHGVAGYFFLALVPLATGTGILSAARSGSLDLLFGTGQTRAGLWWFAFAYGWGIPSLMAMIIMGLTGPPHLASTLLRLTAVLVFTGGVTFSVGLVEPRAAAGVIWLLARFILFITPAGMETLKQLQKGRSLPKPLALALVAVAAPESALDQNMPLVFLVGVALLGLFALAASHRWLGTTDFGGKRT
jgi:hypothetical protein